MRQKPTFALLVVAGTILTSLAHADPTAADRETARNLLKEGDRMFAEKDLAGALRAYTGADALMHVPTTGVEVAKAQAALGQLVEARDTCLRVNRQPAAASEPEPMKKARRACDELARDAERRIPSVTLQVKPATANVTLDGQAVPAEVLGLPRKLDPGVHKLTLSAPGFLDEAQDLTLVEGDAKTTVIELTALPDDDPRDRLPKFDGPTKLAPVAAPPAPKAASVPAWAWVGFGVGVVGLGLGAATGILSLSAASDAKALCAGNVCPPSAQSNIDSSVLLANVSNVSFAVGAAGVVVGVIGVVLRKPTSSSAALSPYLTPASAGLAGRF